jgi:hypothetical protein
VNAQIPRFVPAGGRQIDQGPGQTEPLGKPQFAGCRISAGGKRARSRKPQPEHITIAPARLQDPLRQQLVDRVSRVTLNRSAGLAQPSVRPRTPARRISQATMPIVTTLSAISSVAIAVIVGFTWRISSLNMRLGMVS